MLTVDGGFGFVDDEVVGVENVCEIAQSTWDEVAFGWGSDKADVIDDRHADKVREAGTMSAKDKGKCDYKEKGAEGIALSNTFM
jgi:hypothetical protein